MVYKELSEKDTPENFQGMRQTYIAKILKKRPKNRRFSKDAISVKMKNKRKRNKTNSKQKIALAKESGLNQNAMNLSCLKLTSSQKLFLAKRPSFIPTPADINWYEL